MPLDFTHSKPLTFGVELELMVLNTHDYNLARGASDLLARLDKVQLAGEVKPEITESMIELNSAVHTQYDDLLGELVHTRDAVVKAADRLNLAVAGGGAHPFHKWSERRIAPGERFEKVSALYGYLAKQFTVFGQHIHIGVSSGDDAIRLAHGLSRYIPHFIALSASSPFSQGHDTSYETSRLHAIASFPLAGHVPPVASWDEFNHYFDEMAGYGIVESMKDFYWDIRPKPEYGTVEIRICDTPLTVERASQLAGYAQTLSAEILEAPRTDRSLLPQYRVYGYNRFEATRFGYEAELVDADTRKHVTLREDILETLRRLRPLAVRMGAARAINPLIAAAQKSENDSSWLRERLRETRSYPDVVRLQAERWRNEPQPTTPSRDS
jgi:glutamate---cysteine ligase / carboxylate-amine ligase